MASVGISLLIFNVCSGIYTFSRKGHISQEGIFSPLPLLPFKSNPVKYPSEAMSISIQFDIQSEPTFLGGRGDVR